ncbi:MAG: hypothetical protein J2P45_22455 [Candidatus Dormibacteraeota bacterium]|nr:hypothetical protein [Candidatus Dormibacteraeota bacterium]
MELIGTLNPVPSLDGGVMGGWVVFVVAMAILTVLALALQFLGSRTHRGSSAAEAVAPRRPRVGRAG